MAPYSLRHTFLIDPDGVLQERWVAVRPSGPPGSDGLTEESAE